VAGWLDNIEHIVVLMLENRSFDHMLGYLALPEAGKPGDPVCGVAPGMTNIANGAEVPVARLNDPHVAGPDPDHSATGVAGQLAQHNGGFAQSYADKRGDPSFVMGYYDTEALSSYDLLSREFCVCDRWFCSAPGPTWLNRLYALTGDLDPGAPGGGLQNRRPPLYKCNSFIRQLDKAGVSWRWYSHTLDVAPATLPLVDEQYVDDWGNDRFNRFRSIDVNFPWTRTFHEDARHGELPALSWLDPKLMVDERLHLSTNDDHHPADVRDAQLLVRRIYDSLAKGKKWNETLLLITYDEHGGFHDHVAPPRPIAPPGERDRFAKYGPRVPALAISPWLPPGSVCSETFDHTTIIKTVMTRFCPELISETPPRARAANELSILPGLELARSEVPAFPEVESVEADLAERQLYNLPYGRDSVEAVTAQPSLVEVMDRVNESAPARDVAPTQREVLDVVLDGYERPPQMTELQEDLLAAAEALRAGPPRE
jgi:phospholipase C